MEGVAGYQQPWLDGWGNSGPFYDHRFLGYDRAPYRSVYVPAQPTGPYLESLHPGDQDLPDTGPMSDDSSLSEEEDEEEDGMDIYSHVSLQKIVGKQLAVWCHRSPDTLAIFTPIPSDSLSTAVSFARSSLQCDPSQDRVLLLLPGHRRPLDPATLQAVQPGSSMLVVPRFNYVVTLEVTQLKVKLQMVVSVTMTVRQVKAALQRHRGFPINRIDLLHQDQPMENQRHLFDYHVKHGSTIFVMLHLLYDMQVTVETFWGLNYTMYVDPCMTTSGLLDTVLRRTVSPQAGESSTFFHLVLPSHALVMYAPDGAPMRWGVCLGLYVGSRQGATLSLSTIALAHQMSVQSVPVVMSSSGNVHSFRISCFDYWSVLALKLHGFLGYPVNLMRLFHGRRELDLARAAGSYSHKTPPVHLDMSLQRSDPDVETGVYLTFRLGRDVEEELLLSPTRSVKSVKSILEEVGIPNATAYDLVVDGIPLPDTSRIGDVVEEMRKPIDLKLRHYPVFVHAPKNVIYKMNAHAHEALDVFKGRVELKTGLSQNDYYMLMAGMPVTDSGSRPIFQSSLAIGSSVFLMALQQRQVFFVVWDDWLVKLRLPFHPQASEIKDILLKDRNIPEGSLASVGNFLQWYFAMRATKNDLLHEYIKHTQQILQAYSGQQRQSRPRRRQEASNASLWRDNRRQIRELQEELEKRYQTPPGKAANQRASPRHLPPSYHPVNVPPASSPSMAPDDSDRPGLYYATHRNGRWHRVNPEDIADSYLRAWSLPPDPLNKIYNGRPRRNRSKKARSAMADLRSKMDGRGRKDHLKQTVPEDRVDHAYAGHTRRKQHRRKKAR